MRDLITGTDGSKEGKLYSGVKNPGPALETVWGFGGEQSYVKPKIQKS